MSFTHNHCTAREYYITQKPRKLLGTKLRILRCMLEACQVILEVVIGLGLRTGNDGHLNIGLFGGRAAEDNLRSKSSTKVAGDRECKTSQAFKE